MFLLIVAVIGTFCISSRSLINVLTCFSPVGKTCFMLSMVDGGKGSELFKAHNEVISKGLHGIAL